MLLMHGTARRIILRIDFVRMMLTSAGDEDPVRLTSSVFSSSHWPRSCSNLSSMSWRRCSTDDRSCIRPSSYPQNNTRSVDSIVSQSVNQSLFHRHIMIIFIHTTMCRDRQTDRQTDQKKTIQSIQQSKYQITKNVPDWCNKISTRLSTHRIHWT